MAEAHEIVFARILDDAGARLSPGRVSKLGFPSDEIHQEILLPLLPAMLADKAIRQNWRDHVATGFYARLKTHLNGAEAAPRWQAADLEIHVTASYLAGADAKALADTLLSEPGIREAAASVMNALLDAGWPVISDVTPLPLPSVPPETPPAATQLKASPLDKKPDAVEHPRRGRVTKGNPIRGMSQSFGGMGSLAWNHSYPLRPEPWTAPW